MKESKLLTLSGFLNILIGFGAAYTGFLNILAGFDEADKATIAKEDDLFTTLGFLWNNFAQNDVWFQTVGGIVLVVLGLILLVEAILSELGLKKGSGLSGATGTNIVAAGVLLSGLAKNWQGDPKIVMMLALVTAVVVVIIRIFALLKFFTKKPTKLPAAG